MQAAIRAETGDKLARVLQIGLGGENLVRFAALTNELRHFNGRTGMGAVMGSKNLKADRRARARGKYPDLPMTAGAGRNWPAAGQAGQGAPAAAGSCRYKGTPGLTAGLNAAGILPTRNFHERRVRGGRQPALGGIREGAADRPAQLLCVCRALQARGQEVDDRYQVSDGYGGPEYETIAGFGSNCGVDDLQAVAKANELCGRYTLDSDLDAARRSPSPWSASSTG